MSQKNNPHPNQTRANDSAAKAAAKATAEQTKAQVKEAKTPKVDAKLAMTITVVAEKNPKRENSASHARFAIYKTGMNVGAYIDACVAKGQLRRAARADIDWDTKHKFIELKDATPAK